MTRTTYQAHAIHDRKIHSVDYGSDGHALICAWEDCDRYARSSYVHVFCKHDVREDCDRADRRMILATANPALGIPGEPAHRRFAFCSAGHLDYWQAGEGAQALHNIADTGRAHGNHTPGNRGRYG